MTALYEKCRPVAGAAISENQPGGRSVVSVPPSPPSVPDDRADIPTLDELSRRGRAIVLAYIEAERISADERGYARCLDDFHARAEMSAEVARLVSSAGPYADLAERRGQGDRAAAQRAILAERGISI